MAIGFIAQGIVGLIMGGCLNLLVKNCFPMFVVMYGLFLMMGELGPGDTIGLVSAEIWPTSVRGTCYGISAGEWILEKKGKRKKEKFIME
jgi:hypothetical protein